MSITSPLSKTELVDAYFIENRTRILDIAAFLDRLERTEGSNKEDDFRMRAFRRALRELVSDQNGRIERVQMLLSDPTTEPREALDRKGAWGTYKSPEEVL